MKKLAAPILFILLLSILTGRGGGDPTPTLPPPVVETPTPAVEEPVVEPEQLALLIN